MRKHSFALMLSCDNASTLNCGAAGFDTMEVRSRNHSMSPVLSKVMRSGAFIVAVAVAVAVASASPAQAQSINPKQSKQIEEIAQDIATKHNANPAVDDMTLSSKATAVGRKLRFEQVLRVKKGLPPAKRMEFARATQREVVPLVCVENATNSAVDRGLTYTFTYHNTYGEKLAEFTVDRAVCKKARQLR